MPHVNIYLPCRNSQQQLMREMPCALGYREIIHAVKPFFLTLIRAKCNKHTFGLFCHLVRGV